MRVVTIDGFLANLPDPADRQKVAHVNTEALYRLGQPEEQA